jgi:hypothetical protein
MPTSKYTKDELAEHARLVAERDDTKGRPGETQEHLNGRLKTAANNLAEFMNKCGQRLHAEVVAKHAAPKVTPFTPE